jgi:hypothetical protein
MSKVINVADLRARLDEYPILQTLVDFVVDKMMLFPFDTRYAKMLEELNRISEPRTENVQK